MASIQNGETVPPATFQHVPWTPELADARACGKATSLSTDTWKGKKVVLFAVPGAFTPTCHIQHLPGFIAKYKEIKEKGVDVVACVASNDIWVMSAWGRVHGIKDEILMLTDPGAAWSQKLGLNNGERARRYALIIDDLVVKSVEVETKSGVLECTGADHVLEKL